MDSRTRLTQMRAVERLAARDATLFADPAVAAERLGWIGLPQEAFDQAAGLAAFGDEVAASGITDVVLAGMGGSSLAPLVLSRVFGHADGRPALHVLDTSSPAQVAALLASLAPASTLVVVSSKSGSTVEPLSLAAVFRAWLGDELGDGAGRHFIAITDPGSPLVRYAGDHGFLRTFLAPPEVGGRYAALTPFATVPAALAGLDVAGLAAAGLATEQACRLDTPDNPGAALGAWLADAYTSGRDKVTLVVSRPLAAFGLWVEQLIAESTGKEGAGLLPVLEDAPGDPASHGADRMTFVLRTPGDDELAALARRLSETEPVFESVLTDTRDLGGEFVRWEWAVALLSALTGIEPFDQPNVAEAKAATEAILRAGAHEPVADRIEVTGPDGVVSGLKGLVPAVERMLSGCPACSYLALLAYLPDDAALLGPLHRVSESVGDSYGIAVTPELGPRYLHSTGQYHKGGPRTGLFVVISAGSPLDVPVPGASYTLGELNRAQASGDVATLRAHGRPVVHVSLPDPGIAHVEAVVAALRGLGGR